MSKIILDLCGGTGSWSKPYKEAGYDVRLVTLPNNDVTTYSIQESVHGILAAPPCTEFSNLKHFFHNNRDIESGMKVVDACLGIIKKCSPTWWALENPKGTLSTILGKPAMSFEPYQFGDGWTKRTHIWGNFCIPMVRYSWESCPKVNLYVRPSRSKPSVAFSHKREILEIPQLSWARSFVKTDSDARAITPPGFAKAFFEANP
jgi:hypothetical protein